MLTENLREALTFDDVLLMPGYSDVLPREVDVSTRLVRDIRLKIPLMSAAMDTVTESGMAIAMARLGGIGVIHKNLTPVDQAKEVRKVKRAQSATIFEPVTVEPDAPLSHALDLMRQHRVSGLPVVRDGILVGILTARDIRFVQDASSLVFKLMTPHGRLVTVAPGVSPAEAKRLLHEHRIEKLLVVEGDKLVGLITIKDLLQADMFPDAVLDDKGQLLVAAAVGPGQDLDERSAGLIEDDVDVLVVDTAHGHSKNVEEAIRFLRANTDLPIIAGNIATEDAAAALIKAGADAVKVGIGPGSICTTRIVAGVGVPQVTAIADCAKAVQGTAATLIADGGIKYSGDVAKAVAAGADAVMIGSLFAGTDEAPGEIVLDQGRSYKNYRGMGSIGAMRKGSADRYGQAGVSVDKLVPEGVEARVPARGAVGKIVDDLVGGLRSGMGYVGAHHIAEMKDLARFIRQTSLGLRESHVHDVTMTEEPSNYHRQG